MLPPKVTQSPTQQRLLKLFRDLPAAQQEQLVSYAEFLAFRLQDPDSPPDQPDAADQAPDDIPRPESESVIAAIRRLSKTFHMLNKDELLHETSALMTAHVMHGKPAPQVIDELEELFRQQYDRSKSGNG